MKKAFIFLLILGIAGSFFFFRGELFQSGTTQPSHSSPSPQQERNVPEKMTEIPSSTPSQLSIPKLGVEASIESVGMNNKGEMDVPKKDMDVAWYNLGYKPGDNGSAVIAGHFDTRTGAPAVFYDLGKLSKGDEIIVTYPDSTTYTFEVTNSDLFPYDNFPLQRVFNTPGTPTLNLITCDGVFDRSVRSYTERRVVFAKRKE